MISKTRRNRISKTRRTHRNRISKTKRISGGEKGDVHTWNLGICLIKQKEGYINDTYWIECPDDPLPDGWKLVDNPLDQDNLRLPIYQNLTGDKEIYPGIGDEIGYDRDFFYKPREPNNTIYRPLLEPGNDKMSKNEYIQKLQTTEWKQTKRYMNDIDGVNKFIEKAILEKHTWKRLVEGKANRVKRAADQSYNHYSKWRAKSGDSAFIYNLIINFNEAAVPQKFKKLYTTARNWNLNTMKDWF